MPGSDVQTESMRIVVCTADDELRAWIFDELVLMSWGVKPRFQTITQLSDMLRPDRVGLLIVSMDALAPGDVERMRDRPWKAPIIGIGIPERLGLGFDRILSSRPTSRELEAVIGDLIPAQV